MVWINQHSIHSKCCYLEPCLCRYKLNLSFSEFLLTFWLLLVQFSSVAQLCPTLWDPMNRGTPGLPVHHQLPEFTQTHVHWVSDAIQPSHPLSSAFPPALNLSQHQGLFQWVSSSHQVAKVLEFQLQHQSFQWTTRTDLYFNLKQIDSFHHLDKHLTFSWDNEYMCFTNNTMS